MHDADFQSRADELIEAGHFVNSRGWVPATSGNFSARLGTDRFAVTVSGSHKGYLDRDDFTVVDAQGQAQDGRKPSAETLLHTHLYRHFPAVMAVLHAHTPGSVLASRLFRDELVLENHELLKVLAGIDTHEARVVVPIFPNDQDMPRLAAQVDRYLKRHSDTPGYIIGGHGVYTWGDSVGAALRHLEALEFMFDVEIRLHGVKTP